MGEAGIHADQQPGMADQRRGLGQAGGAGKLHHTGRGPGDALGGSGVGRPPRITGARPSSSRTRGRGPARASSNQCFWGRVVKGAKTAKRPASSP